MPRCLVALGANLGDREHTLHRAIELLTAEPHVSNLKRSAWHETAPVGGPVGQPAFLNGAVAFDSSLASDQLHAVLRQVEDRLGRRRNERWAARSIDLDLLLYGDEVSVTTSLNVPHPRMAFRRFVLEPAAEVAPEMVHPALGWTIARLLDHCRTARPYVALMALAGCGKTALAESLAKTSGGRFIADPAGFSVDLDEPNPTGHARQREIQFLDRRSGVLDTRAWPSGDAPAVSDFYFDQSLAYARVELDADGYEAVHRAWAAAHGRVVSPKLLVVLDESADDPPPAPTSREQPDDEPPRDRLRRELLSLAARRDIGPVLYSGGMSPLAQFEEIQAALAAMQ